MNGPYEQTDSAMIFRSKDKKTVPAKTQGRQQPIRNAEALPTLNQENQIAAIPKKHVKPKLLLLDLDPDVAAVVTSKWSDVVIDTLGQPYEVKQAAGYAPVINHAFLSGHKECEVIVADFKLRQIENRSPGEKHRPREETDVWAKQDFGFIDNRGLTGLRERETFERIIRQGGIMIIFADRAPSHVAINASIGYGGQLTTESRVNLNVWNISSPLEYLQVSDDHGSVMKPVDSSSLGKLIAKYLPGSDFTCTVKPRYPDDEWVTLAVNKYDELVSAALGKEGRLVTLVVPQLADKAAFLDELLTTVLPEYVPDLFPEIATGAWTHRPEYELQKITELRVEKTRIEEDTRAAIAALDDQIKSERTANGWLHDLLTATGDDLVSAVKRALVEIGFTAVVDVDEIRDQAGQSRREDLRIEDRSPVLVVDIKGIGGRPSDEDAIQANKHAMIHMRESGNPNVHGLSIINHERHIPPLDRDNAMPFRDELLTVADETELGLMTSFDLYRIVVNMRRWAWPVAAVQPLLYAKKRIGIVPVHYEFIGTIAGVWAKAAAFGVVIQHGKVNVGDTLAVEGQIYFEELSVPSIRVDNSEVKSAGVNDQAGFPYVEAGAKIRVGMRVYAVRRPS